LPALYKENIICICPSVPTSIKREGRRRKISWSVLELKRRFRVCTLGLDLRKRASKHSNAKDV
jgi:hypothetical protein